jgi:hypothetical protein
MLVMLPASADPVPLMKKWGKLALPQRVATETEQSKAAIGRTTLTCPLFESASFLERRR